MKLNEMTINALNYAIVHSTIFHADDVFGVALLRTIRPELPVVRTCRPTDEQLADLAAEKAVVFDLGCQFGYPEYDHHQLDKALRPDGNPYCGFGLLWRDLGHLLCSSEKAWAKVDRDLVLPIDLADNGVTPSTLSAAIGSFNPTWEEGREAEETAFWQAEAFAEKVLRRYVDAANAEAKAEALVLSSTTLDDGRVLLLDQYLPWQDTVINKMPDVLFVVYPSARGGYNIQTVPDAPGSFNGRKGFPERWLGNPAKELGMTFCHPGNFLAAADTKQHAIKIAIEAIHDGEYVYSVEYDTGAGWKKQPGKYRYNAARHEAFILTFDEGYESAVVLDKTGEIVYRRWADGCEWEAE